jgi:hypothetical protein
MLIKARGVTIKPGHGQPGPTSPAQKFQAWATFFGPMGGPRPQNHGPTAYSGWAWVAISDNFGMPRPNSPTTQQETAHSGWAWADIF